MIDKIASSIEIIKESITFVNKQRDIGQKLERLNELLIQINSAIEFAKAREPIQNIWLCKWLQDLEKTSREGAEVQSVFEEGTGAGGTTINPFKGLVRLYERSKKVSRLNNAVMRLERKASGCEEFLRRLRYELNEQRRRTYIKRVGKLETTVVRLKNCLRSLKSDGKFKKCKKTKLPRGRRGTDSTLAIISEITLEENHDEIGNIEDIIPQQIIQERERANRKHANIPKFGEWKDGGSSTPYTVVFDKARLKKTDPNFNPNDPSQFQAFAQEKPAAPKPNNAPHRQMKGRERREEKRFPLSTRPQGYGHPGEDVLVPKFGGWNDPNSRASQDFMGQFQNVGGQRNHNKNPGAVTPTHTNQTYHAPHATKTFIRHFFTKLFRCIFPVPCASPSTHE